MGLKTFAIMAAALVVGSCGQVAEPTGPVPLPEIAGRTAGPPESCVRNDSSTSVHLTGNTILFTSGATVWVNATRCPAVTDNDIPIFEPSAGQYCRGDIVHTVDRLSHISGPTCVLGDFTPYRRPPR